MMRMLCGYHAGTRVSSSSASIAGSAAPSVCFTSARMRRNPYLGGGLIMPEAVMLELGATIGRQHAHDVVYDAGQAAAVEGRSFGDLLAADPRVTAHLDAKAIKALLDPTAYTGLCAEMAREGAVRAREGAASCLA